LYKTVVHFFSNNAVLHSSMGFYGFPWFFGVT
jgi:hypothetical protein